MLNFFENKNIIKIKVNNKNKVFEEFLKPKRGDKNGET